MRTTRGATPFAVFAATILFLMTTCNREQPGAPPTGEPTLSTDAASDSGSQPGSPPEDNPTRQLNLAEVWRTTSAHLPESVAAAAVIDSRLWAQKMYELASLVGLPPHLAEYARLIMLGRSLPGIWSACPGVLEENDDPVVLFVTGDLTLGVLLTYQHLAALQMPEDVVDLDGVAARQWAAPAPLYLVPVEHYGATLLFSKAHATRFATSRRGRPAPPGRGGRGTAASGHSGGLHGCWSTQSARRAGCRMVG